MFSRSNTVLLTGVILCAILPISPAVALLLGIAIAFAKLGIEGGRWADFSKWLLKAAIVALGAGIDLPEIVRVSLSSLGITLASILFVLLLGESIGRLLRVPRELRRLVSSGTAICGGSAIAAVAATLDSKQRDIAASLGIVFILNAIALLIFPMIGHHLGLSQKAFAWWAALAIHDTSSVVGAAMAYGTESLELATIIKLARALWIIPIALGIGLIEKRRARREHNHLGPTNRKPNFPFPLFILGFIGMAGIRSLFPALTEIGDLIAIGGHHAMATSLFLIGASLSPAALRHIGWRPALLGISLWLPTATIFCLFALTL